MTSRLSAAALVVLLASACGPSNSLQGTVGGLTFTPQDAVIINVESTVPGAEREANLFLVDRPMICADFKRGVRPKGLSFVRFVLRNQVIQGGILRSDWPVAGTYSAGYVATAQGPTTASNAGLVTLAQFTSDNDLCQPRANPQYGNSGTVVLENFSLVAAERVRGSFDVRFRELTSTTSGERLTGTFDATVCDGVQLGALSCG